MRVLLKVIISRNSDGVHINQSRSSSEWEHISRRGFNPLGTSHNFGSVIHLAVKPFHLSSSMNRSPFSKMSIFMENSNDSSFLGVKESSSSHNIQTSLFMIINAHNIDLPVCFCRILMSAPARPPLAPLSTKWLVD